MQIKLSAKRRKLNAKADVSVTKKRLSLHIPASRYAFRSQISLRQFAPIFRIDLNSHTVTECAKVKT